MKRDRDRGHVIAIGVSEGKKMLWVERTGRNVYSSKAWAGQRW